MSKIFFLPSLALVYLLGVFHITSPAITYAGNLDCSDENLLVLPLDGGPIGGDPSQHPSNVPFYNCFGGFQAGGEVICILDIPPGPRRVVQITQTGPDAHFADASLFLLNSCDENDCIAYSASNDYFERITICLQGGRRYYVVGDGSSSWGYGLDASTIRYCWNLNREEARAKKEKLSSWGSIKSIFR